MAIETLDHNIQNNVIVNILTDRDMQDRESFLIFIVRDSCFYVQHASNPNLSHRIDIRCALLCCAGLALVFPCHFDLMSDDSLCFEN